MNALYTKKEATVEDRLNDLLSRMTLEEKAAQLCQLDGRTHYEEWIARGIGSFLHVSGEHALMLQKMAEETRLGIPILFGIDAIHGHAFHSGATVFPTQLGMSSSWNIEGLKEAARICAREVAATGVHWTFSPVLCLGRDTRWGRINETFGEDPYLAGELGAAMIKGYQGASVSDPFSILACAKHYLAYGESTGGRDSYESDVPERKLRSIFLPPFKKAVDAGCATVMAGYQAIDGVPCSANKRVLKDILRDELKFDGFVVTDWNNIGNLHELQKLEKDIECASKRGLESGNDMIMTTPGFYDAAIKLVEEGRLDESFIDQACRRILAIKFEMGLFDERRYPAESGASEIGSAVHREAGYKLACESMVLLKNNGMLPLADSGQKIAVIGPNADNVQSQLGDWSFGGRDFPHLPTHEYHPEYDASGVVTVLEGIRKRHRGEVLYAEGCPGDKKREEAVVTAMKADRIIAVLGDSITDNGERRDRSSLQLDPGQAKLLYALAETGKPLAVVLLNGKPLEIQEAVVCADAILEAWNPGCRGGDAVASILFGDVNPSGKLSITFPHNTGQLPVYYNQLPGWHGGKYIDVPEKPLYPFGFGLSYTTYEYSNLRLSSDRIASGDSVSVHIDVKNTGERSGSEIVQLYINDCVSSVTTPVKELKGFRRVALDPGEKKTVTMELSADDLSLVTSELKRVVEPGEFEIMAGPSSENEKLLKTVLIVE